jgi:hypothetical protein
MVGFCSPEVNEFGPTQLKPTPAVPSDEFSRRVLPEHTGELLPAVGTAGRESTSTERSDMAEGHPLSVATTE